MALSLILLADTVTVELKILDAMYAQSKILDGAIRIADAMLYPNETLLNLSTAVARKFHRMHTDIIGLRHGIRFSEANSSILDPRFVVPKKAFHAVDEMWTWLHQNGNVLFRVSLKLARLPNENIAGVLTATHPSTDTSRDTSVKPMLPRNPPPPRNIESPATNPPRRKAHSSRASRRHHAKETTRR
jgi:hypothetical protein